jgi:enoyl-CoA hydratase/carnithine racemase
VLTFNRPEARNAMTWPMYDALLAACDCVDTDAAVRVLVLKGAGGKAFVSGTDIGQFTGFTSADDALRYERRMDEVLDRVERVRVPTIAAVQGVATGGGCLLALCCDIRVCTSDSRFGVPIARTLGNCLSAANCARLVDLLGPSRAKELIFSGRLIGADEAQALGLVARVVDVSAPLSIRPTAEAGASALDAVIGELVDQILSNAPLTIRATKEMVRRVQEARRESIAKSDDLVTMCYTSEDFREGVAAFVARRPPRFTGR